MQVMVLAEQRYRKINGSMDEIRFVQRKGKVKTSKQERLRNAVSLFALRGREKTGGKGGFKGKGKSINLMRPKIVLFV